MQRSTGPVAALLLAALLAGMASGCEEESANVEVLDQVGSPTLPVPSAPSGTESLSPTAPTSEPSPSEPPPAAGGGVTRQEFCRVYLERLDTIDPSRGEDGSQDLRPLKQWAAEMESLGTPAEMSTRAREGIGVVLTWTSRLPDEATLGQLERRIEDLGQRAEDRVIAAAGYTSEFCDPYLQRPAQPTERPSNG